MDWNAAIDNNREALKRALAALLVMAGFVTPARPATLPRHLHRAVLRLLRPAEAALRRLVIVAALGLVVTLPPLRPLRQYPVRSVRRDRPEGFALFDPLPRLGRQRSARSSGVPRIAFPCFSAPTPLRPAPMPLDPIDAAPLFRRLAVFGDVLDDLPRRARRFACWQVRRAQAIRAQGEGVAKARRVWPLRPGRPPGLCAARNFGPDHDLDAVLDTLHGLALWALEPPDTS